MRNLMLFIFLFVCLGGIANAQVDAPQQGNAPTDAAPSAPAVQLSSDDKKFLGKAAISGMSEVEAGQVASESGNNASVKTFGRRMVNDHQRLNQDLTRLAESKGVSLPTSLDKSHQKILDKLKKKSGADFDKAYAKPQVEDHEDAIDLFEEAAASKDPDIAVFARTNLDTLRKHLQMAKDLENRLKD